MPLTETEQVDLEQLEAAAKERTCNFCGQPMDNGEDDEDRLCTGCWQTMILLRHKAREE